MVLLITPLYVISFSILTRLGRVEGKISMLCKEVDKK